MIEKDLLEQITNLKAENARLEREKDAAENMLEYERNKYRRQLAEKEAGIIEEVLNAIGLELQAIADIAEYLDENDRRRIRRRLDRINDILLESD